MSVITLPTAADDTIIEATMMETSRRGSPPSRVQRRNGWIPHSSG